LIFQKVKNVRRLQKLSYKSIAKAEDKHCCRRKCLQGGKIGLSKSDIMACREEFWKLDENKQRNYILTYFTHECRQVLWTSKFDLPWI
jgi:hypothetical protein